MASDETDHPGRGWYSRQEMAAVLDVSEQHFDRSLRPLAPAAGVKTVDRRPYFHGRKLLDAWAASLSRPSGSGTDDEDGDDGAPDSPWLEKLREYRARQERVKLALMDGTAIPRDQAEAALAQFFAVMRQAAEALQRQYDDQAAGIFNDAIDEAERSWAALLAGAGSVGGTDQPDPGDAPPGDGGDEGAAAAADAPVR